MNGQFSILDSHESIISFLFMDHGVADPRMKVASVNIDEGPPLFVPGDEKLIRDNSYQVWSSRLFPTLILSSTSSEGMIRQEGTILRSCLSSNIKIIYHSNVSFDDGGEQISIEREILHHLSNSRVEFIEHSQHLLESSYANTIGLLECSPRLDQRLSGELVRESHFYSMYAEKSSPLFKRALSMGREIHPL